MALLGGIEAGGTKFICAVGSGPDAIREQVRFATTTAPETIGRAVAFFAGQPEPVIAVGIGSFGPLDPDPASPTFGRITTTPKSGWQDIDFVGAVHGALKVPVGFDTDVNAAALGERRWGAARDVHTFAYLTVGTGVGGGAMVAGNLVHGLVHPEMGHIRVPHDRARDPFPGICPYHGDCLEGLASGPAIQARWGQPGEALPPRHPAWTLEAEYLALGLVSIIGILSPQRIILGGGLMRQPTLWSLVRANVAALLNRYLRAPAVTDEIDRYIVPPGLGERAGVLGALALAQAAIS